jgi:phosphatidylglycerol:prolipoprotein diacylglycerol transferase
MDPIAFHLELPVLGNLAISWYGLLTLAGWHAALFLALYEVRRLRLMSGVETWDTLLWAGGTALVCAHLLFQLTPGRGDPSSWRGGLVLYGAILGGAAGVAFAAWRRGKPVWKVLDAAAAPGIMPPLFGRIGCLTAGCCYGEPCDLPWAITFTDPGAVAPRGVPLHPTQLYSIGALLALFGLLWWRRRHKAFDGELAMLYLGLYSAGRFAIEIFRGDIVRGVYFGGWLSFSQLIALPCMLAALVGYLWLRTRRAPSPPGPGLRRSAAGGGAGTSGPDRSPSRPPS